MTAERRARIANSLTALAITLPRPEKRSSRSMAKRGSEESRLRSAIVAALLKDPRVGWAHANVVRRTPYGWFGLGAGSADIVGVMKRGRALFVEVKLPDDPDPDEHQQRWLDARRADGAIVIVATSVEDAINGLPGELALVGGGR